MALSISSYMGYATNGTSAATLTSAADVNASVGDLLVVLISADNAGTNGAASISSVSDSNGHTYTQRAKINRDPGSANQGITLGIYTTTVTSAMVNDTVTVSFSPNTQYKTMAVYKITPDSGYTASVKFTDTGTTGNTSPIAYTSSSLDSGEILIAAYAGENISFPSGTVTGDSDTTRGSWSTRDWLGMWDGGSNFFGNLVVQYKTVTGTGTQTWNLSVSTAPDYAATTIGFKQTLVAPTYTLSGDTALYDITESDAGLQYGRIFAGATAAYLTTGTAATLTYAKGIAAEEGVYLVDGTTAGLTKGGVPSGQTLTVDAGMYNYNGTDASFKYTYVLVGEFGSYGIDGQVALVTKGRTLDATTGGTYSISGTAGGFLYGYVFTASPDSYFITGAETTNYLGKAIIATGGSYSVSGTAAALTKNQVRLVAEAGAYGITGVSSFGYVLDGTTFRLDPRISFYSNRDGLVYSYPRGVNFLKYIRNRVNTNERNNLRITTRTAGSGLLSPEGFVRINIVAGTSYTGLFSSTGALNVILSDPDTNNSQMFHPYGPLRVTEATSSDYGMVADDGSVYAEILR